MTREELLVLIQSSVNSRALMSDTVRNKCKQLQSLLKRKEQMSTDLVRLFQSVSKCENTVRQLYSRLGWDYKDPDSEGNHKDPESEGNHNHDNAEHREVASEEADHERSTSPVSNDAAAADSDEFQPEERPKTPKVKWKPSDFKEPRVVLHRLPIESLRAARKVTAKRETSDDDASNTDSDYQPSTGSSDSDFSLSSAKSDKQKKKKCIKVALKVDSEEEPAPQHESASPPDTNGANEAAANETEPDVERNVKTESKPLAVSSAALPSKKKTSDTLPFVLQELKVDMQVLAKRKKLQWETGKISEIVEKEDGSKKFKVTFEDKGKMLVSEHHVAYDAMPKLVHLAVGGRVVSKSSVKNTFFTAGILGELPSRKNHMRFLVFFDDQKTSYVALPVLRLVFNPLPDPLDDLRDEEHHNFMKEYLERMPYPAHTQFRVGQKIKVERDGAFEACTVLTLDSSLMEVLYAKDEEKEWIYRGSLRLEHVSSMKEKSKK